MEAPKVYVLGIPSNGGLWIIQHRCYQDYQRAVAARDAAMDDYAGPVVIWMLRVEDADMVNVTVNIQAETEPA